MQIKDVMSRDVRLTSPDTTISAAANTMAEGDFGVLPVGDDDRLIGTITDRDIAVRGVAKGKDPMVAKVREVMSEGVLYCFEDQDSGEVAQKMADEQVRRLPVVNRDKRLVGIVALSDLAAGAGDRPAAEALGGVSQGAPNA